MKKYKVLRSSTYPVMNFIKPGQILEVEEEDGKLRRMVNDGILEEIHTEPIFVVEKPVPPVDPELDWLEKAQEKPVSIVETEEEPVEDESEPSEDLPEVSVDQLVTIKGIGPFMAGSILEEYREGITADELAAKIRGLTSEMAAQALEMFES